MRRVGKGEGWERMGQRMQGLVGHGEDLGFFSEGGDSHRGF